MGILRGMNCLMVEVFRELQLVQTVLQKVILALQNKSAQMIKNNGRDPLYKPIRLVPLQRVWFLHRFGLKTMIGHPFQNYDIVYVGFFAACNRL